MAVRFRDYYEVLGVPRTATADEIKAAFRKLARRHHPDLATAADREQASERFKAINEAYEVLRDPGKRAKYDELGEHWKSGMDFTPPPGGGAARTPGGGPAGGFEAGEWPEEFSDFFESLFGARTRNGARRGRGPGGPRAGGDVEASLTIPLVALVGGGAPRFELSGRTIEVKVPPGARDGTVLRLAGQGAPGADGGAAGDLYLVLRVAPDPRWRVAGDDVEMELRLWPWQAVLGASVRVETLDGAVSLTVPPGSGAGTRLRLRERGLPVAGGGRGDLYAVVRIEVPAQPAAAEREAYEALRRAATAPPDRPAGGGT